MCVPTNVNMHTSSVIVLGEDRRIGFLLHSLICDHVHTDNCDSQPCQNGGTCTSLPAGYNCSCPHGYEGTQCERGRCLVLTKVADQPPQSCEGMNAYRQIGSIQCRNPSLDSACPSTVLSTNSLIQFEIYTHYRYTVYCLSATVVYHRLVAWAALLCLALSIFGYCTCQSI